MSSVDIREGKGRGLWGLLLRVFRMQTLSIHTLCNGHLHRSSSTCLPPRLPPPRLVSSLSLATEREENVCVCVSVWCA